MEELRSAGPWIPIITFFALVATTVIAYYLRGTNFKLALAASTAPGVIIFLYAAVAHSLLYALSATIVLTVVVVSPIYERYISEVHINDAALITPAAASLLLWPSNLQPLHADYLVQLYGVTLQSFLTLIGLVFTLGIFMLGAREMANSLIVKEILKGFLVLFIILSLIAVVGMFTLQGDVDISRRALNARSNVFSYNTLAASTFIATICLLASSIVYLVNVFAIFIKPGSMDAPS